MQDKEKILYRILAGKDRVVLSTNGRKKHFWIHSPSVEDKLIACDVYEEAYAEATLNGLITEEETIQVLKDMNIWSRWKEEELEVANKNIDKLKIGLFKSLKKRDKEAARLGLAKTRELIKSLMSIKYQLSYQSIEYFANTTKLKFLIGRNLYDSNGRKVWENEDFLSDQSTLLEEAYQHFIMNRVSELQIRQLARTDPWRPIWVAKCAEHSIFGKPAIELSEEQKGLISWSRLYDSCYEDPERPSDEVIEEDDCFDGWLMVKRDANKNNVKNKFETALQNPKIAGAQEVFIMNAEPGKVHGELTDEDLETIHDLNNEQAKSVKHERMKALLEHGEIHEGNMPDTKRFIDKELHKLGAKP